VWVKYKSRVNQSSAGRFSGKEKGIKDNGDCVAKEKERKSRHQIRAVR